MPVEQFAFNQDAKLLPYNDFHLARASPHTYPDLGKKEFAWHTNQVIHPSDVRPKNSGAYAQANTALLRA